MDTLLVILLSGKVTIGNDTIYILMVEVQMQSKYQHANINFKKKFICYIKELELTGYSELREPYPQLIVVVVEAKEDVLEYILLVTSPEKYC